MPTPTFSFYKYFIYLFFTHSSTPLKLFTNNGHPPSDDSGAFTSRQLVPSLSLHISLVTGQKINRLNIYYLLNLSHTRLVNFAVPSGFIFAVHHVFSVGCQTKA
jgi:hypothetical protein